MENKDIIINGEEDYGPYYKEHLLKQYHTYINGIDKVSQQRQKTNDFFLTINTAALAFMGVMNKAIENDSPFLTFAVSLFGIVLCVIWYRLIRTYRDINRGKYQILHKLEEKLPAALYKAEWEVLGKGADHKRYLPISHVEIKIPLIFIAFYLLLVAVIYLPYILG